MFGFASQLVWVCAGTRAGHKKLRCAAAMPASSATAVRQVQHLAGKSSLQLKPVAALRQLQLAQICELSVELEKGSHAYPSR